MGTSWLLVVVIALFGAIVGSFLNVVIYRLPRGMSIRHPARSFCPQCRSSIHWSHNVPIVGWLRLRGRCNTCGTPIAARYPLVEAVTAVTCLFIWDRFFVARPIDTPATLASQLPLLIAAFGLFASLIASAVIDIETYTVDIRVCIFAMILGVLAFATAGLPSDDTTPSTAIVGAPLPPMLCLIGAAMGLTWLATWFIVSRLFPATHTELDATSSTEETVEAESVVENPPEGTEHRAAPPACLMHAVILTLLLIVIAYSAWLIIASDRPADLPLQADAIRSILVCGLMFFLLILAGLVPREVDDEIYQEIVQNRSQARTVAAREAAWLAPALVVGIILLVWLRRADFLGFTWHEALEKLALFVPASTHVAGALSAIGSMIWAASIGWTVRILGTITFGKEAYGTGDIYLMAAIGACAGIWNCFFGFFAAALLALLGTFVMMFRKRSRAIPFGPWLALGSLCALPAESWLLRFFRPTGEMLWSLLCGTTF